MAADTRASIVVVAHNSARDLPACLESVIATIGPTDEVIVVDSASADGSAEVASRYPVRVLRSDRNLGYGGGGNLGAAHAAGRYLVFLNPDTAVEPGWLDALLAPLAEQPGLATSKLLLMDDPTRLDTCANQVHLSGITVCRAYGRPAGLHPGLERVLAVSGASFAVDRHLFERLGGFDARFFMYLEDTDLSLRAALAGAPCWYVGGSVVRHRHIPSFVPRKMEWLERNRWLMLLKVWSLPTLLRLAPTLLLFEALVWTYALLSGPAAVRARLAAWRWLLAHPWTIVEARRRTQRLRVVPDGQLLARCTWRLDTAELVSSPALARAAEVVLTPLLALGRVCMGGSPQAASSR